MIGFVMLIINTFLLSFQFIQLPTTINTVLNLPNAGLEFEAHTCAVFDFRGWCVSAGGHRVVSSGQCCQGSSVGTGWSAVVRDSWVVVQEQPGVMGVQCTLSCCELFLFASLCLGSPMGAISIGALQCSAPFSHAHNQWGFCRVLRFPGSVSRKAQ